MYGRVLMAWRGTAASIVAARACSSEQDGLTKLTDRAAELSRTVPDAARLVIAGVITFDA